MLRNSVWLLLLLLVALLNSCKSKEMLTVGNVKNITDARLRSQLQENELSYDKLYLKKVQFSLKDGSQKKSFKGSFVIQKDSQIIVSIFALMGIELVRVRLTPEDVIIIDKHNKVTTITKYDYFNKRYGVKLNYYAVQAILSNSVFLYPVETDNYEGLKKYKHYIENDHYSFKSLKDNRLERFMDRGKEDIIQHEMYIYPDLYRIFNVVIEDLTKNQSIQIAYKNFRNYGTVKFPEEIDFSVQEGDNTFELDLKINYLEINDGGSLHFKIPSAYTTKVL